MDETVNLQFFEVSFQLYRKPSEKTTAGEQRATKQGQRTER